jgi:hypothetical protein
VIHIRIDDEMENAKRKFQCGLGPELPPGDTYFYETEPSAYRKADCIGCNPGGPKEIGTPISRLSGTIGMPGYREFCDIASSWGYD